jgi:hypothetical protein
MHIVAIYQLQGAAEQLARELAGALGTTPYEARQRVIIPGGGPVVVATFASAEPANDCVARLHVAGFASLVVDSDHLEIVQNRLLVRQLQFASDALQIIANDNQRLSLPYHEVKLLLRGAGIVSSVQVETSKKKKFAIGRAVASGGLVMRKTVKTVTEVTNQERQPFCHLSVMGQPSLVLRQAELDYTALGAERLLSRDANFNWICAELRRRCPAAAWDDRLQTRPGLVQLLGPTLNPEHNLDLAIALIAKSCSSLL